jgi:hypothetical protein
LRIGERLEEDGIHSAENCSGRADAQAQDYDRRAGKTWIFSELPQSEMKVLNDSLHETSLAASFDSSRTAFANQKSYKSLRINTICCQWQWTLFGFNRLCPELNISEAAGVSFGGC